jgi:hypothetical protein
MFSRATDWERRLTQCFSGTLNVSHVSVYVSGIGREPICFCPILLVEFLQENTLCKILR